ncbi:MAG: penicillin acylase family protein [Bryobacteraceae bacterium]
MSHLKYINLSIAVLVVAVLAAIYWVAFRPLPQTSGELAAPISGRATVTRDVLGIPHISAATLDDAFFLQGFVTAQDRLWQMDALRRLAAGELSEVVGGAALESDRDARRLRMRRTAEAHYRTLPPADRAVFAAYARGVNYFIQTHLDRLPLEFTVLRYDPRPWSVVDSLLAGLQMYRNLTTTYRDELKKQTMLAGGDPAKVNFLFPSWSGREFQPGSNAWAISGTHTASGKPLLANDPHLEYTVPATWYQVHLQAPGLNVTGVSLPGVPCVVVGHNERIAWGVTNLGFDVEDLYREKLDPNTGRYLFSGRQEQARFERELIPVKGAKAVEFSQWVTRHGPVLASENGQYYALRWAASEPGSFQFPFADLNRARNWREFTAALSRFPGPGQNFVYADMDGNIGYHATGMLPVRRGYDGSTPADGSSGEFEWDGFISFEELPSFYNPPSGLIVTANQNPFPAGYPHPVHGDFAPPYRSRQIRDLLSARNGFKPEEMLVVQKDVYSAFLHFLAKQVVAAYDRHHSGSAPAQDAVELLRRWNGQVEKGTPAPMIAALTYLQYRKRIAEVASPGKSNLYEVQMAPAMLQQILEAKGRGWFSDPDSVLLQCLAGALDEGRRLQGGKIANWDYGLYNELTIQQPVGNRLPFVGSYFNVGPIPMSGASTTVKQTTRKLGPSMRFVADLSDWEKSLNNLTVGESGQILSSHYRDQWNAYYVGRSFPMQFGKIDAKQTLTIHP